MRPRLGSAYHIERSIARRLKLVEYPCACTRCRGSILKKVEVVARHHEKNGRDPYLIFPVIVSYCDMMRSLNFYYNHWNKTVTTNCQQSKASVMDEYIYFLKLHWFPGSCFHMSNLN